MAQQKRPIIAPNPAIRAVQPVMLFDKMLVRVYQRRGKDLGKNSFAYVTLVVYFLDVHSSELPAVSLIAQKSHSADCADTLQCCPSGNTIFLFQLKNLQVLGLTD